MSSAAERPLPDWEAFYRDYRKPGYVPGFEITTKLGGGMFGLVYRARRMSIGKDYAIKFLQVDDGEVQKAVLAELEAVKWFAQIDHPNLVSIEDRGEVDGIPYLVMAFAGTETLRDKVVAGRVPTAAEKDELLRWFLQCCRGLAALHERSLVHFDIKPANVFLKGSVARLGDYGLSKLVTHSRGSLSMGRGTPYYMAPEMLQRRGDHRSDIYSLGVMLYELLCGQVPFQGDSEWEVLKKHESEAPAIPAHLTARETAIVQRCLQKDPAARFASVHDLIAAFGAPTSAGAAAWSETNRSQANPQAPPLPSAPSPSPVPPPVGPPAEDPYQGLSRASKEAVRHAGVIAQKAAKEASRIAREAAAKVRQSIAAHREKRRNGWFGARRRPADDPAMPPLPVDADGDVVPPRRRSHWGGFVAVMVLLMFVPMVLFGLLAPVRGPVAFSYGASTTTSVDAGGPSPHAGVYQVYTVPSRWNNLVSTNEPRWAAVAQQDRDAGKELLMLHIERLRQGVLQQIDEFADPAALPRFDARELDRATRQEIDQLLAKVGNRKAFTAVELGRLEALGPLPLAEAAHRLVATDWNQAEAAKRGRRLHNWLVEATDCRDLQCAEVDGLGSEAAAAKNRKLGALWAWFVNEFGYNLRTWNAYCELMRVR